MKNAGIPNTFSIKQVASSLRRRMPLAASLLGAALILGGCQTPPPPVPTTQVKPGVQILNAGDVIEITFPGATNLNTTQQIRRDGKVNLYMIGETPAANRSPGEFEKELIAAYSSQLISKEIKVKVVSSAFSVFVTGAVMKPGKVMSERELTAFDAIMEAGGFGGTILDGFEHAHAGFLFDAGKARDMAGNGGRGSLDAEGGAAHPAMLQDLTQHIKGGVGGNREADALGAANDGGVDADDASP